MKLIFFLFIAAAKASPFSPETLSRDLQKHLLKQLSHGADLSKYREIDLLFKTQKMLRISCEIELRDLHQPDSCFRLIELWEKTFHRKDFKSREELQARALAFEKRASIQQYIHSRKNTAGKHRFGMESE